MSAILQFGAKGRRTNANYGNLCRLEKQFAAFIAGKSQVSHDTFMIVEHSLIVNTPQHAIATISDRILLLLLTHSYSYSCLCSCSCYDFTCRPARLARRLLL